MPTERWKTVPGFPDYIVSDLGAVASVRRGVARPLAANPSSSGYPSVRLHNPERVQMRTVHSLVAEVFIGPRPLGHDVCHNDGDRDNNDVRNLRYDTRTANLIDRREHGRDLNHNKTHCPSRHPYDSINTRFTKLGHRKCRTCDRNRHRARKSVAA